MSDNAVSDVDTHVKTLRLHQTEAEKIVWSFLRNNQLGYKFRRQHKIADRYIVDFICLLRKLIVEIDGGQHRSEVDHERTMFLEKEGFRVLRFWNNDVLSNKDGVFVVISSALQFG